MADYDIDIDRVISPVMRMTVATDCFSDADLVQCQHKYDLQRLNQFTTLTNINNLTRHGDIRCKHYYADMNNVVSAAIAMTKINLRVVTLMTPSDTVDISRN